MFLGLAAGRQPIELQVDSDVKALRVFVGEREVAHLTQPPWRAEIDLGPELIPREVLAIAYDEHGTEIGRASQFLNLPRANTEVENTLQYNGIFPSAAQPCRHNLQHAHLERELITRS